MTRPLPSRGEIIACLAEAGRPLHAKELTSRLGVIPGSAQRLSELLDQLCLDGAVVRLPGQKFKARPLAERKSASWEGVLSVNPRGFGFVVAAGQPDLYIAADGIGPALHGDRVRVSVARRSDRGWEGHIEEIVKRRSPRVAGVLRIKNKSRWLEPDDARLRSPIVLTRGPVEGRDGQAAVAEIMRFPRYPDEAPEGQIVAVLGLPGEPNTEVAKILVREQISEEHPEAAMHEAEAMAAKLQRLSLQGRRDLRAVPLPTIDPEDARDHDDALWVERLDDGYRAYVAIADVSEYVPGGSALDAEARARGCTLYLPDRAVPMLPAALAADLCSLLPEQDRLCLCVIAEIDRGGAVRRFEVVEGVMRSAAMLTYEGVARTLGFTTDGPHSVQAEALRPGLKLLDELSRKLRRARMRRGALDLNLPQPHVQLDAAGVPTDVVRQAQDPGVKRAYQMVEELMLLANELVAQWLSSRRAVAIYRVHPPPDAEKLERLAGFTQELGLRLDLRDLSSPEGLGRWLSKIAEHPRRTVLEMLTLRSLKQAFYDIVNVGHFGLASDAYLHFTSPIRRYPDLVVHRIVKGLLHGERPVSRPDQVELVRGAATESSARERASMDVEREVVDLYRALLMRDKVGQEYEGTVSGISGAGLYVALDQPYVDVMLRFEALGDDRFEVTENELAVCGVRSGYTIQLGDRIRVVVEEVSVLRRTTFARRIDNNPAKPGRRGPKAQKTAKHKAVEQGRSRPASGSRGRGRSARRR